jgi:enoyl-CoA hydratase/carnithine racemase
MSEAEVSMAVQSTTGELVTCDIDEGVAVLTWNRPERRNSWSVPMEEEYFALLRRCTADPDVRAIVVTGAGTSFCPGLDSSALSGIATGTTETRPQDRQPMTYPATVPKPMIAAINGACAGLGLIQALMCDVRIAGAGVKFSTAFARRGIMAEHGIAWLLPRIVGTGRAMDLLLSARVFPAEEALELGLVNRVVPREQVLDAAVAYARDLAENCSPIAMGIMKQQVRAAATQDLELARMESLRLWLGMLKKHPDFAEGIASYLEKRPPKFAPWEG